MNFTEFFIATSNGLIFTILGYIYYKFPPRKINWWYGYRTRRSMANQQIWDYANALGAKMILYLGITIFISSAVLYFLTDYNNVIIISLFMLLIGIGIGMYWCGTQLNKRYDKNGNPKNEA